MLSLALLVLCAISLASADTIFHSCGHDEVQRKYGAANAIYSPQKHMRGSSLPKPVHEHVGKKRELTNNIRIRLDTTYLKSHAKSCFGKSGTSITVGGQTVECDDDVNVLLTEKEALLMEQLSRAESFLESFLEPLVPLDSLCLESVGGVCGADGGIDIPSEYSSVNSCVDNQDLVLFVTDWPTVKPGQLAFALACRFDSVTGRPVAGHINVGPNGINVAAGDSADVMFYTILHEVTHVLGINANQIYGSDICSSGSTKSGEECNTDSGVYNPTGNEFGCPGGQCEPGKSDFWIPGLDGVTGPKQERAAIISERTANADLAGKPVTYLKTPRATAWAKEHFGCADLEGIELEDADVGDLFETTPQRPSSHLEMRVYREELMASALVTTVRVTGLVLAILEDTGWYAGDYSKVSESAWGKNAGCTFAQELCKDWDQESYPLCSPDDMDTDEYSNGCTWDLQAFGDCGLQNVTNLESYFTYFEGSEDGDLGGPVAAFDRCPVRLPYAADTTCTVPLVGRSLSNSIWSPFLPVTREEYGDPRSRCFRANLLEDAFVPVPLAPRCYIHRCSTNGLLQIKVEDTWHTCPRDGGFIEILGFRGGIQCPVATTLCCDPACVHGSCLHNVCSCDAGYCGDQCELVRGFDDTCSIMAEVPEIVTTPVAIYTTSYDSNQDESVAEMEAGVVRCQDRTSCDSCLSDGCHWCALRAFGLCVAPGHPYYNTCLKARDDNTDLPDNVTITYGLIRPDEDFRCPGEHVCTGLSCSDCLANDLCTFCRSAGGAGECVDSALPFCTFSRGTVVESCAGGANVTDNVPGVGSRASLVEAAVLEAECFFENGANCSTCTSDDGESGCFWCGLGSGFGRCMRSSLGNAVECRSISSARGIDHVLLLDDYVVNRDTGETASDFCEPLTDTNTCKQSTPDCKTCVSVDDGMGRACFWCAFPNTTSDHEGQCLLASSARDSFRLCNTYGRAVDTDDLQSCPSASLLPPGATITTFFTTTTTTTRTTTTTAATTTTVASFESETLAFLETEVVGIPMPYVLGIAAVACIVFCSIVVFVFTKLKKQKKNAAGATSSARNSTELHSADKGDKAQYDW